MILIFDLTLSAVKKSAEISSYLDSNGYNIGKFDSLIAGIIIANGYNEILTKNKDLTNLFVWDLILFFIKTLFS
jgi:predicted nucleic acid-binding protein